MSPDEARQILAEADLIRSADEVQRATGEVAAAIRQRLAECNPLVLTVMGGAVVFAGNLLPRLDFPLECDYVHATRYGDLTRGGRLEWIAEPRIPLAGRHVLVIDDILDEGITLAAIKERILAAGARECLIAVLADKDLGRKKPVEADFTGLRLPNRYVFGYGMDVKGAWRNLPAIYAVRGL